MLAETGSRVSSEKASELKIEVDFSALMPILSTSSVLEGYATSFSVEYTKNDLKTELAPYLATQRAGLPRC